MTERVTGDDGVTRTVEVSSTRNVTNSLVFAGVLRPRPDVTAARDAPATAHHRCTPPPTPPRPHARVLGASSHPPPTRSRPCVESEERSVPDCRLPRRRRRRGASRLLGLTPLAYRLLGSTPCTTSSMRSPHLAVCIGGRGRHRRRLMPRTMRRGLAHVLRPLQRCRALRQP